MQIINLNSASEAQREQAAALLILALRHSPSAWKDLESARAELRSFLEPGRLALLAAEEEEVQGWVGAIRHSDKLWELHPLAVHAARRGKGLGARLVQALENEARRQGVTTIWLGTDDDFGGTNLFGVELYPDVLDHLKQLESLNDHPFVFYQKLGYAVVGAIPDATGPGRHDLLMAKRIT